MKEFYLYRFIRINTKSGSYTRFHLISYSSCNFFLFFFNLRLLFSTLYIPHSLLKIYFFFLVMVLVFLLLLGTFDFSSCSSLSLVRDILDALKAKERDREREYKGSIDFFLKSIGANNLLLLR